SPLIQLPDGVVLNAPQVANNTGQANKVVSIDFANKTVTYKETDGFQGGKALRYASFDSSDPGAAAIEHVTYAPALNNLPTLNDDSTASARASLAGFTNGPPPPARLHQRPARRRDPEPAGPELRHPRRALAAQRAALEPHPGPLQPDLGRAPDPVAGARRPADTANGLRQRPEPRRSGHR